VTPSAGGSKGRKGTGSPDLRSVFYSAAPAKINYFSPEVSVIRTGRDRAYRDCRSTPARKNDGSPERSSPDCRRFLRSLTHFRFTAENSSENLRFPPADFSAFLSGIFPARQSSAAPFTSEKPIGAGSGTEPSGRMRVREKRHAGRPRNGSLHAGRTSAGLRPETAGGC